LAAESIFAIRQNLTECNIYFIMAFITTVNAKVKAEMNDARTMITGKGDSCFAN
jgi:hypothetical protein